ncbi:MAG: glycosyl transferase [Bacteroidales bacterium]|nr:glycosyl transferase [Candidatus Colicola coprequi]
MYLIYSNYAAKGLAMYWSLKRVCPEFRLYVFAFDDILADALKMMTHPEVTVVTLAEFEDEDLLRVKPTRTAGEYCWTCSSSTIYYCLTHFDLDHCTYIDADLYFFSNPRVLIDEMGDDDVLITEHRYTPKYDQSATSGKYCVQFMTFKNTERGMAVLKWWRERCLEWCYARKEDGKFGDQKYLDDWNTRFDGVCELQHLGGGVAPWNMQQYIFFKKRTRLFSSKIVGKDIASGREFDLVFFHFHNCECFKKGVLREWKLTGYELPESVRCYIYCTYLPVQERAYRTMKKQFGMDGVATKQQPIVRWWSYLMRIRRRYFVEKDNRYSYWLD